MESHRPPLWNKAMIAGKPESARTAVTTELPPPKTEEERRARQRMHVKRSYYRKLNRINELREQERQLQERYDAALNRQHSRSPIVAKHQPRTTHELYVETAALAERLRRENAALRELTTKQLKFQTKLSSMIEHNDEELPVEKPEPKAVTMKPLSVDDCRSHVSAAYQEIRQFLESHSYLTTGASLFGWRDRRQIDGDRLKFSMKKMVYGFSPAKLSTESWAIFAHSARLQELYSARLNASINRLQVVDDDNVVMFRVFSSPDNIVSVLSLFMVSRFEIENGYMVLFRSIDRSLLERPAISDSEALMDVKREQWLDMYTWITFEGAGEHGEHTKMDFGGIVHSTSVAGSSVWMIEVLLIALRWENKVIGPIFSIDSIDSLP